MFSQAPLDTLLAHLCWFTVRSPDVLARGFSWQHGIGQFIPASGILIASRLKEGRICLSSQPTGLNHLIRQVDDLPFCVPPLLSPRRASTAWWYRTINLFSITYAFRPRLRDRLTLSRLTLPRKPWTFGVPVSHRHYRYSCQHGLFCPVQPSLRSTFDPGRMLPYHPSCDESAASVMRLAPLNFRRRPTRPVSCYAFFKGWLLLSQPPGCLSISTSFPT